MALRHRIMGIGPRAFIAATRLFLLCGLIGLFTAGALQAHPAGIDPIDAVRTAGITPQTGCCHGLDHGAQDDDCLVAPCCTAMLPGAGGGRDLPSALSCRKPLTGAIPAVSQSHLPILHPPIAL